MAKHYLNGDLTKYLPSAMKTRVEHNSGRTRTNALIFYDSYWQLRDFDQQKLRALDVKQCCRHYAEFLFKKAQCRQCTDNAYIVGSILLECFICRLIDLRDRARALKYLSGLLTDYKTDALTNIINEIF